MQTDRETGSSLGFCIVRSSVWAYWKVKDLMIWECEGSAMNSES